MSESRQANSSGELVFNRFDQLQKEDPEGITDAIRLAGFANEPGHEEGLRRVLEAYKVKNDAA